MRRHVVLALCGGTAGTKSNVVTAKRQAVSAEVMGARLALDHHALSSHSPSRKRHSYAVKLSSIFHQSPISSVSFTGLLTLGDAVVVGVGP